MTMRNMIFSLEISLYFSDLVPPLAELAQPLGASLSPLSVTSFRVERNPCPTSSDPPLALAVPRPRRLPPHNENIAQGYCVCSCACGALPSTSLSRASRTPPSSRSSCRSRGCRGPRPSATTRSCPAPSVSSRNDAGAYLPAELARIYLASLRSAGLKRYMDVMLRQVWLEVRAFHRSPLDDLIRVAHNLAPLARRPLDCSCVDPHAVGAHVHRCHLDPFHSRDPHDAIFTP